VLGKVVAYVRVDSGAIVTEEAAICETDETRPPSTRGTVVDPMPILRGPPTSTLRSGDLGTISGVGVGVEAAFVVVIDVETGSGFDADKVEATRTFGSSFRGAAAASPLAIANRTKNFIMQSSFGCPSGREGEE
jgi:hypothetical protein